MRTPQLLGLLTICALFAAPNRVAAGQAIPQIVEFAAQTSALENAGIIVHERHITVAAQAGPAHFSQDNDALLLMEDGAYRHIHFMRIIENGHVVSNDQLAKTESSDNRQLESGQGFFKQPFDHRFLADYSYSEGPVPTGVSGLTVHFASAMRDAQHGEGDMQIDPLTGHVLSLVYTPYVFPDHANSGSVTETFGQALPGLWTIVRIDRTYSGRVLFVKGNGTVSEVLDHFRRFSDANAGLAFYHTAMQ